jgi:hypothetical protein
LSKKKNKLKKKIEVKESGSGLGLYAKKDFKKDAVIGRIKGKVVDDAKHDPRYVMSLATTKCLCPKRLFDF